MVLVWTSTGFQTLRSPFTSFTLTSSAPSASGVRGTAGFECPPDSTINTALRPYSEHLTADISLCSADSGLVYVLAGLDSPLLSLLPAFISLALVPCEDSASGFRWLWKKSRTSCLLTSSKEAYCQFASAQFSHSWSSGFLQPDALLICHTRAAQILKLQ